MDKKINLETEKYLICTNCGNRIKELYKQLGNVALKLTKCEYCKLIADKYIECDLMNIIIDLILLKIVAIRHFLFNSSYKNVWKLSLVLLLLESYLQQTISMKQCETNLNDTVSFSIEDDLYLDDLDFYKFVATAFLQTCCFVTFIHILTKLYALYNNLPQISFFLVWKSVTLANCSCFLTLPALIWDINSYDVHSYFIHIYSTLSQLLGYRAISNSGKLWTLAVISLSYLLKQLIYVGICHFPFPWFCCHLKDQVG